MTPLQKAPDNPRHVRVQAAAATMRWSQSKLHRSRLKAAFSLQSSCPAQPATPPLEPMHTDTPPLEPMHTAGTSRAYAYRYYQLVVSEIRFLPWREKRALSSSTRRVTVSGAMDPDPVGTRMILQSDHKACDDHVTPGPRNSNSNSNLNA
eukprot:114923-Rhodomonas_salina.2